MVHPATQRVVRQSLAALAIPLDLGWVFPPRDSISRGFGVWTGRDLTPQEIVEMLPQAAAANARGAAIYIRPGPSAQGHHPGIVLVDDLDRVGVERLKSNGLEPCLIVESSPCNFQAWIKLAAGPVPYAVMGEIARHLANAFNGDPRAISPRQPSRLPGFTNRKSKHQLPNGQYPFVKLIEANPGLVAGKGLDLIERFFPRDLTASVPDVLTGTGGAGAHGATPKTPPRAAAPAPNVPSGRLNDILDAIRREEQERIQRQVTLGRRPVTAASASEVDFAVALSALRCGLEADDIAAALSAARPEKSRNYGTRTVDARCVTSVGIDRRTTPGRVGEIARSRVRGYETRASARSDLSTWPW